jgi:riboflavin synthase
MRRYFLLPLQIIKASQSFGCNKRFQNLKSVFSGIIETIGKVENIIQSDDNLTFLIRSLISKELKIDQSIAHNGVCLTVTKVYKGIHSATAIKETLDKSNLGMLNIDDEVNLERCLKLNDRLDGHIVQGHVDQTAICKAIKNENGSWVYTFEYDRSIGNITVEKGSICVNGASLTVVNSKESAFSVAIIPYTYEHTNFKGLQVNSVVNLEFDIVGKYIARLYKLQS